MQSRAKMTALSSIAGQPTWPLRPLEKRHRSIPNLIGLGSVFCNAASQLVARTGLLRRISAPSIFKSTNI
jgi:hypothetical protein